MGLLDDVMGQLGGTGTAGGDPLMNVVKGLLTDHTHGGLAGLLEQLKAGGLGHVASSWVGSGQNLPISPEQITQVLGPKIGQLARQFGLSADALPGQLSNLLPGVVDKLTPHGTLPDQSSLQDGLGGLLKGLLG